VFCDLEQVVVAFVIKKLPLEVVEYPLDDGLLEEAAEFVGESGPRFSASAGWILRQQGQRRTRDA